MATTPTLEEARYYRVKKVKNHNCALLCETNVVSKYIVSGNCVPQRRFFRKSLLISIHHPQARHYAKSIDRFRVEEILHLDHYYYMIHPFSDFHFIWQTIMTIVHLMCLIIVPIYLMESLVEYRDYEGFFRYFNTFDCFLIILNIICMINIFLCFLIGYYDKTADKVVLNPGRVFLKYLCTHFFFDLISSLNLNMISRITRLFDPSWYYRIQWSFKIIRLFTINEYLDDLQMRLNMRSYLFKICKFALFSIPLILWLMFFNYILAHYYQRDAVFFDLTRKFFLVADNNLRRLFLCDIKKGDYEYLRDIDFYVSIVNLHCGKFFEIWLMAKIFQIFSGYMMIIHKYQELLYQVDAFIRLRDLPKRLNKKIFSFLSYRFQYLVFNEKALVDSLCPTLKMEILKHTGENLVTKVAIFKDLPQDIIIQLVDVIKSVIYLPNDLIIQAGEFGYDMFFIYSGDVAVFTPSGKEVCHLSNGEHFGEISLLLNEPRIASVVAIDFCELYVLTKKDFSHILLKYEALKSILMRAANQRSDQIKRDIQGYPSF